MSYKINISDLSPGRLNGACLAEVAKFAMRLEQVSGLIIDIRQQDVLATVVKYAHHTEDERLLEIYAALKVELRKHINSEEFSNSFKDVDNSRHSISVADYGDNASHK